MKYGVTLCAIVGVRIDNVEASSPAEALSKAREVDLTSILDSRPVDVRVIAAGEGAELAYTEFADDFTRALVDELDEDGEVSSELVGVFDFDGHMWKVR